MTTEGANVRSLDAIDRFRAQLVEYIDAGRIAMSEAESDIERTRGWLEREQVAHWNRQLRKRAELVARAKSELYRKQTQASAKDSRPSVVDEKKALQRAERRLEEARERMKATKKWIRMLEREQSLYKGNVAGYAAMIDRELPHAVGLLKKMSENLEQYVSMSPPDLSKLLEVKADATEGVSRMRRTGGDSTTPGEDSSQGASS